MDAPLATERNLKNYNDGVIIPALTFLRKNMSSLTPEGKKLTQTKSSRFWVSPLNSTK